MSKTEHEGGVSKSGKKRKLVGVDNRGNRGNAEVMQTPEAKANQQAAMKVLQVERALVEKEATDTLMELVAPKAKAINAKLKSAKQFQGKSDDHRLSAAVLLAEARKDFDDSTAKRVSFKKWFEEHIKGYSYETGRVLLRIGQSDNPMLALKDQREVNRTANVIHRGKAVRKEARDNLDKNQSRDRISVPVKTPFMQALDAMKALEGKAVQQIIKEVGGKDSLVLTPDETIVNMKQAFTFMKPTEKMVFLRWAAKEVGAKLDTGLDTDPMDVPGFLKRVEL